MLQAMRDRVTGWIAYIIVFLISIPFALWGIQQYFGGGEDVPAATVNDTEISQRSFEYEYARTRQQLLESFGGQLPPGLADDQQLKSEVLERLINEELLTQHAGEFNYRVADPDLGAMIRSLQAFQENGEFTKRAYEAQLRSQGMTPAEFEGRLRNALRLEQLQNGVRASALITDEQLQALYRLEAQQRELAYLVLPRSNYTDRVVLQEDELKRYYDANAARFMRPERVKLNYIELSVEQLANTVPVDDALLEQLYEEYRNTFVPQEKRQARHILVRVPEDAGEDKALQAKVRLLEARERIRAGESFAEVAKDVSDDPGSAAQGGDLGQVERGMMVAPFEEALFALEVGEISEPVKTRFGWHLIQLEAVESTKPQSLQQVGERLKRDYQLREAENRFYDLAESLATEAYEQPDSLLPAAEALGLTVQQTDWVTRGTGEGIAASARVRTAAFSEEVLKQGINSEMLELDSNHVAAVRVAEHQSAAQRSFDDVRDEVEAALRAQKVDELMAADVAALREAVAAGEDMAALAEQYAAELQQTGLIGRGAAEVPAAIVGAAFGMGRETEGPEALTSVSLADGDRAVLRLLTVKDPDPAAMPEQMKAQLVALLQRRYAERDFGALLAAMKTKAEIQRNPLD